jgi:hypothetical protein
MVRILRPNDDEAQIEAYPGFLALEWDEGDLFTDTKELLDFWRVRFEATTKPCDQFWSEPEPPTRG